MGASNRHGGMSKITARYIDTCLSDYLQDGCNRPGQALCLTSPGCTLDESVDALFDSIDWDSGIPESVPYGDVSIKDALRSALQGVDLRYIDEDGNRQEEPDEDRDSEEPYIYVVLEWDATEVEEPAGEGEVTKREQRAFRSGRPVE
jgi:hypothetical protein